MLSPEPLFCGPILKADAVVSFNRETSMKRKPALFVITGTFGKPALFSLSNGWAKFYQVDKHRKPVAVSEEF